MITTFAAGMAGFLARTFRRGASQRASTSIVTAVVCVALGAVAAAMASLNVALPDLARSTGASQTQLEWIIDAYSLVFAALLLPAGALGDRYGRRRALIAGLAVFAGWELRASHPMLDPRHFRNRRLSAGSLSIFIQFFAFFGFTFVALQYLQGVRGDSPLRAAVSVLPLAVAMMLTARLTPGLTARLGASAVGVTGLVLVAAGLAVISRVGTASTYWLLLAGLVPLGIGMGAAMTPATAAITEGLPATQQGVGSALNDLSREVGGALGIAVIGSIVTAIYRSHLHLAGVPAALASKARGSFAVAIQAGGPVRATAGTAFTDGIHTGLPYAASAALLAAIIVAVLLSRGPHPRGRRSRITALVSPSRRHSAGRQGSGTVAGQAAGPAPLNASPGQSPEDPAQGPLPAFTRPFS